MHALASQIHACAGERLLLASIIRRAVYDIALYKNSTRLQLRRRYVEEYHWMFAPESSRSPHFTSFISLCTILDQDPAEIRRKTLKLRRCDVKKIDIVGIYV